MFPTMSTHRNIFDELDWSVILYPTDIQTQPYRLTIDFTELAYQRDLVTELAHLAENFGFGNREHLLGLLGLLDDILEQRVPPPGGPQ